MSKNGIFALFAVVCVLQLAAPASMIYTREVALQRGEVFKFKTAPVDPYDAFRGRYVALNYELGTIAGNWEADGYRRGRLAYAVLERDAEGYARITDVTLNRPDDQAFVRARITWSTHSQLMLTLPFDRYYMDEFDAPVAEQAFMWQPNQEPLNAYVITRVHNGFGVIEELIVEDMPIQEWLLSPESVHQ